ncbi:MAG: hypothetical protein ACOX5J_17625 [Candidatus Hydrogenedentales bacterium]|jgi:hypothetical protein
MNQIMAVTTRFQGALTKHVNRSPAALCASGSPARALVLLLLISSSVSLVQIHADDVETGGDEDAAKMIERFQDNIAEFLKSIPASRFDTIEFRSVEEHWWGAHSKAAFILNHAQRDERLDVDIDLQTGQVVGYMWPWPEPESKTVPISEALSMIHAFEAAKPVLRYYGLSENITDYEADPPDTDDPDRGLVMADWRFSCNFEYEGLPCRHTGIWIKVSAFSGRVRSMTYVPVVEPKPVTKAISKEAAIEIARRYLPECKHLSFKRIWLIDTVSSETRQVIAFPNTLCDDLPTCEDIQPWNAYYCWEVPFEHEHPTCGVLQLGLWITMESGIPVGGE